MREPAYTRREDLGGDDESRGVGAEVEEELAEASIGRISVKERDGNRDQRTCAMAKHTNLGAVPRCL